MRSKICVIYLPMSSFNNWYFFADWLHNLDIRIVGSIVDYRSFLRTDLVCLYIGHPVSPWDTPPHNDEPLQRIDPVKHHPHVMPACLLGNLWQPAQLITENLLGAHLTCSRVEWFSSFVFAIFENRQVSCRSGIFLGAKFQKIGEFGCARMPRKRGKVKFSKKHGDLN